MAVDLHKLYVLKKIAWLRFVLSNGQFILGVVEKSLYFVLNKCEQARFILERLRYPL